VREGTGEPARVVRGWIGVVGEVFGLAQNEIASEGHSRAHAVVLANNPSWDRSLDKAVATRGLLEEEVTPSRIRRVTGHGDREPFAERPMAVRNDRLEIILLRQGE